MDKPEVHISEVNCFRRCRLQWHFSSRNRMNLERSDPYSPFFIGSAIHYAIAAYYTSGLEGAQDALAAYLARVTESLGGYGLTEGQWDQINEDIALCRGMVKNYARWAKENDYFTVAPELPVLVDMGDWTFRGTADGLIHTDKGKYLLSEVKTARSLPDSSGPLFFDNQHIAYLWATAQDPTYADIEISGVLYTFLRKKLPTVPNVLKSGQLTRRKLTTTYETYLQALKDHGLDPKDYEDYLRGLKEQESPFFTRFTMPRNKARIKRFEKDFLATVDIMLNDPKIFPSPTRWSCPRCPYAPLCKMYLNGRSIKPLLEKGYKQREADDLAVV